MSHIIESKSLISLKVNESSDWKQMTNFTESEIKQMSHMPERKVASHTDTFIWSSISLIGPAQPSQVLLSKVREGVHRTKECHIYQNNHKPSVNRDPKHATIITHRVPIVIKIMPYQPQ